MGWVLRFELARRIAVGGWWLVMRLVGMMDDGG